MASKPLATVPLCDAFLVASKPLATVPLCDAFHDHLQQVKFFGVDARMVEGAKASITMNRTQRQEVVLSVEEENSLM